MKFFREVFLISQSCYNLRYLALECNYKRLSAKGIRALINELKNVQRLSIVQPLIYQGQEWVRIPLFSEAEVNLIYEQHRHLLQMNQNIIDQE